MDSAIPKSSYKMIKFDEIFAGELRDRDGLPLATRTEIMPAQKVQIAPVSFGDTQPPEFACTEHPAGWNPGLIDIPPVFLYKLRNAVVHGSRGFVTVGDYFLSDAMRLPVFKTSGLTLEPGGMISIPGNAPDIYVGAAGHLFCGFPANRNYAHFLVDLIGSALVPPLNTGYADTSILMPELLSRYQFEYARYFPELTSRAVFLKEKSKLGCNEISISSFSINNAHFMPNPYHRDVALFLKDRILQSAQTDAQLPRKIYISRKDSAIRRLQNEDKIISVAQRYGFTSITLSDLPLETQIRLFANATHVIAPHGAGLTNMLFSRPGTVLCELFQNSYVKWSMRYFASLAPVVYGCVVGKDLNPEQDLGRREWVIDPVRVEYALATMPQ